MPTKDAVRTVPETFLARQPIFGLDDEVEAYELLFRSGLENVFPDVDPDEATSQVVSDSLLSFGLESLTVGQPAFVNASRRVLVDGLFQALDPDQFVIEILETVQPDAQVLRACRDLKDLGFRIALDDYVGQSGIEPLLDLADIVKVDFQQCSPEQRKTLGRTLSARGLQLLAEKVETRADVAMAREAGYVLFQGYYFCQPEVLTVKEIPSGRLGALRVLDEVNRPDIDFDGLEQAIKSDVALSVKLLRYLNSCAFDWKRQINSIREALVALGENAMRRWATLLALQKMADYGGHELMRTCYVRATALELLAAHPSVPARDIDLFLTGLLSSLDVLMGRPLPELLSDMRVPEAVEAGLCDDSTTLGRLLSLCRAHERGDWEAVSDQASILGIDEATWGQSWRTAIDVTDGLLART